MAFISSSVRCSIANGGRIVATPSEKTSAATNNTRYDGIPSCSNMRTNDIGTKGHIKSNREYVSTSLSCVSTPSKLKVKKCRYGSRCRDKHCKFDHSQDNDTDPGSPDAVSEESTMNAKKGGAKTRKCKYGNQCHNAECRFLHPGRDRCEAVSAQQQQQSGYLGVQNELGSNLHVSNYDPEVASEAAILDLFVPYVKVLEVVRKRGYAFVNTVDPVGAQRAVDALDKKILLGDKAIKVMIAPNRPHTRASEEEKPKKTKKKCKYGANCTHPECRFLHPKKNAPVVEEEPPAQPSPQPSPLFPSNPGHIGSIPLNVDLNAQQPHQHAFHQQPLTHDLLNTMAAHPILSASNYTPTKISEPKGRLYERKALPPKPTPAYNDDVPLEILARELLHQIDKDEEDKKQQLLQQQQLTQQKLLKAVTSTQKRTRRTLLSRAFCTWKQQFFILKRQALLQRILIDRVAQRERNLVSQSFSTWRTWIHHPEQRAKSLAKKRAELNQQRQAAQQRKKDKKAQRHQQFLKELEEQEQQRIAFWSNIIDNEISYVGLIIDLLLHEFIRQNKQANITPETVKSDKDTNTLVKEMAQQAYYHLFQNALIHRITVAGCPSKEWNGKTGTIRFYDSTKSKYCVGLDTKKGKNVQVMFFKTSHLDALPSNLQPTSNKKQPLPTKVIYTFPTITLYATYFLSDFTVSLQLITDLKQAPSPTVFLLTYMQQRDSDEDTKKRLEEEERRQEEEDKKRRAAKRAKENAEWEEQKRRYAETKAKFEQWKREEKKRRKGGNKTSEDMYDHFMEGEEEGSDDDVCYCDRCFRERFAEAFFHDFFFGFEDYGDDDEDDEYEWAERDREWSRQQEAKRRSMHEQENKKQAEILGVSVLASSTEIKGVYRKKALKFHPDKYKPENVDGMSREAATEYFKKITNAYDHLMSNFDED